MTTNSQLSTTEPKTKSKTNKETTRPGTESQKWRLQGGYQQGGGGRRMQGKLQGIRSINGRYKIDRVHSENTIGNREAKELTCVIHGQELKWGNAGGRRGAGWRGIKGEKKIGQL